MTIRRPATEVAATLLPYLECRVAGTDRFLLGLAGPPGVGKSVLAAALVRAFTAGHSADAVHAADTVPTSAAIAGDAAISGDADISGDAAISRNAAVVVGMDGFHLRQDELTQRGLQDVKGAPETFDAAGFVRLLHRLRCPTTTVKAPRFDRTIEEPIDAAVTVHPRHLLVVVEGNYLLLDGPWASVRDLLDEIWHLDLPDAERVPLLVSRHVRHGRTPLEAENWVQRSDEANARLVLSAAHRADATLDLLTGNLRLHLHLEDDQA